jgi:hypothetical protein
MIAATPGLLVLGGKGGFMKAELNRKEKASTAEEYHNIPQVDKKDSGQPAGDPGKNTLVFLVDQRKKKIDHTITTPDKYVSRYHYDSKSVDKYLELCPHCRKPTLKAYHTTVADSALNYLKAREYKRGRLSNLMLLAGLTSVGLLFSTGLYYLVFHVLSGVHF